MATDIKILLGMLPLFMLAVLVGRTERLAETYFTFAVLIGIAFVCIAARYYYISLDAWTPILAACWLLALLGFFASIWFPALETKLFQPFISFLVVGIFAHVFCDFSRRSNRLRQSLTIRGGLALLTVYLGVSEVLGCRTAHQPFVGLLQLGAIVPTLVVGVSYWAFLSGKQVLWPWERGSSTGRT